MTEPIVILHGALGDGAQMSPLIEALRHSLDHEILAFDFEGHGRASDPGRAFRASHFAENLLAQLDAAGAHRVTLFGYSMGGYVALLFAHAHPARVARVMTLATKFR